MLELIYKFDICIIDFFHKYFQIPLLNEPMAYITRISDYGLIWMILICILIVSKKYRRIGFIVAFSFLLARIEVHVIKELVKRPRPFLELTYLKPYIAKPTSYSFPSGHAISSFATIGVLVNMIKNRYIRFILVLTAFLVSFSRLYLMVHYPSDLLGGIILGLISSKIAICFLDEISLTNL